MWPFKRETRLNTFVDTKKLLIENKETQTQTETDACPVVQLVHGKKQVDEEKGMEKH